MTMEKALEKDKTVERKPGAKPTEPKSVADAAAEKLEAAAAVQQETIEKVVKVSTEAATSNFERVVTMTKEQVEGAVKAGNDMFKGYEELVTFGKKNFDAMIKSGSIWTKGMQDINSRWVAVAQESMEDSVSLTKAVLGCKNLKQLADLQSDFTRSGYEKLVSESRKLSEMTAKVVEDSSAPLNAQVNVAVEKFTKSLAA